MADLPDRAYNPFYDPADRPLGNRIRFSAIEIQHLGMAVLALTLGFAFVRAPGNPFEVRVALQGILDRPLILLASFLAVSTGFVLHELAHKVVAVRYGCMAEFRAQIGGLWMSLLVAVVAKILFAAPGAVHIIGRVDRRENGIISIVGPATNFVLALVLFPFTLYFTNPDADLPMVIGTVASVNALLAVFNLIPAGPLDGRKVLHWHKGIWGASFAASILLFLLTFFQLVAV